ncbi:MAG: DUF5667 domain-containing protein [Candidatus Paceibacterota bacterium]
MNNFEKKLKESAEKMYSLSSEEHAQMKEHLERYMEIKPIRSRENLRAMFTPLIITLHRTGAVIAGFAIIFVMGGLSAAANSALPGDVLYPVKHVLEDARSTFTFTEESKAEWEVRRLARRVDEIAILEGMGALDIEQRDRIEETIYEHADRANELATKLEAEDDIAASNIRTNVAIELESSEGRTISIAADTALSAESDAAVSMSVMSAPKIENVEEMIESDADESSELEYKETATKQRKAVRELLARLERQKSLNVGEEYVAAFEKSILTPLASLRADAEKAEELFKDGLFEQAHKLFVDIHKKARVLDLKLKRGAWKGEETQVSERSIQIEEEDNGRETPPLIEDEGEDDTDESMWFDSSVDLSECYVSVPDDENAMMLDQECYEEKLKESTGD